jgi:putative heme iron utilization protein
MKLEDATLLRTLLTERQVLSLAVVSKGEPVIGMLPFAVEPDLAAAVIHVSRLAPHGRVLADGVPFAVLIHEPDSGGSPPGQLARVRFKGAAELLVRGTPVHAVARQIYTARFPESTSTFALSDFELFRLPLERGRLVAGFARTVNLRADSLRQLLD